MTVSTKTSAADNIDTGPAHQATSLPGQVVVFRGGGGALQLEKRRPSLTVGSFSPDHPDAASRDGGRLACRVRMSRVCAVSDGSWWKPPEHISDNRPN
jgi:hypothetical protein